MVSGKYAGGITGQSDSGNIDILIANCYNVGSLHGSDDRGEIIGDPLSASSLTTIDNCYYLPTGNSASTSKRVIVKRTDSKTAAAFADGTAVLELLKADRDDSPWDSCQYVATAKMTLPVFKGQGDTHNHQSDKWESNDTEHWQVCACGVKFNKANHSGGTATCTEKAKCTVCNAEYGTIDPANHTGTEQWTQTATTHEKKWSCCNTVSVPNENHKWTDGVCSECGYACLHEDTDKNHICDICGQKISEHTGGTATCIAKAVCEICKESYGSLDPNNHTGTEQWTQTTTSHEKKWSCCGVITVQSENHKWTDGVCSECGYVCQHEDADKNHICDICGKKISDHTGGKATCKAKAVCEICKESYGSLDANNHTDLKHIDAKAATAAEEGNIEYWYCSGCNKYFSDAAAKTEITKAATVTAKLPPQITAGDGAAVTQGEKNELTFTSNASFADFLRVELDGATLEEKNYTKREGSTIITLNRDFAATLSVGEHTLAIVSQHGTATAKFTVKAKPAETATPQPTVTPQPTAQPTPTAQPQPTVQPASPIPRTGDTANPALWFALLIVSGFALAAIFVLRRKANRK